MRLKRSTDNVEHTHTHPHPPTLAWTYWSSKRLTRCSIERADSLAHDKGWKATAHLHCLKSGQFKLARIAILHIQSGPHTQCHIERNGKKNSGHKKWIECHADCSFYTDCIVEFHMPTRRCASSVPVFCSRTGCKTSQAVSYSSARLHLIVWGFPFSLTAHVGMSLR